MSNWKPSGYSSASPYLLVADPEATMSFLEAAFDANRMRIHHRDNGDIMHAEARIDDTIIMMGGVPVSEAAHVHVYVPNADKCFSDAIAAGGSIVQEMKHSGDGDYRGGVADPNGIVWWISQQSA